MELLIMDSNFAGIGTLDVFESLIWTDRYYEAGDFELYMPASEDALNLLKENLYLYNRESEHIMVIEDIQINTDVEESAHLTVTGRSLESLLDRRIIWNLTTVTGTLQDGIKKLLNENAISPSDPARKIPGLIFKDSKDPNVTSLYLNAQYWGENLYDTIESVCESAEIGWKITLDSDNQMVFELYAGTDRSYNQTENPYVIFSPTFDNLLNSNYVSSSKTLKTVTLITGEGEGSDKKYTHAECANGAGSGLSRREMHSDGSSIFQTDGENTISDTEYLTLLKQKGIEDLAQNLKTRSFEGEVTSGKTYTYGVDYFMGDIVQNVNEFNVQATSRVIEYVMSQDTSGLEMYPTFSSYLYEELPEGYSKVEYIEADGLEYIDTGFTPNQDSGIEMEFARADESDSANRFVFGTRQHGSSSNTSSFCLLDQRWAEGGSTEKGTFRADYGSILTKLNSSKTYFDKITVSFLKNRVSLDSSTYTFEESTFTSPKNLLIFGINDTGSTETETEAYASYKGRLYYCKMYSNDLMIRNYIPVRDPNGEYGLWDLVDGTFYRNASGSGKFTGPE